MLTALGLKNFRCHQQLRIEGLAGHNVFLGENAQGKTSILEAIYFLSRCRSFRAKQAREMISQEAESFSIEGHFSNETYHRLACTRSARQRQLEVDGISNATLDEYWGLCASVIFKNRDLDLIHGAAQNRRQWMDGLIAQGRKDYLHALQRYQEVLEQKNALLKNEHPNHKLWEALLEQRRDLSRKITDVRQEYTRTLSQMMEEMLQNLLDNQFEMEYQADSDRVENWENLWNKERRAGFVVAGPHRDEWVLKLGGQALRTYGSEGQQRSTALALKLAETRILTNQRGKCPLLLFDDVFKELDPVRVMLTSRWLPANAQTFMATTRKESLPETASCKVWKIHHSAAHLLSE